MPGARFDDLLRPARRARPRRPRRRRSSGRPPGRRNARPATSVRRRSRRSSAPRRAGRRTRCRREARRRSRTGRRGTRPRSRRSGSPRDRRAPPGRGARMQRRRRRRGRRRRPAPSRRRAGRHDHPTCVTSAPVRIRSPRAPARASTSSRIPPGGPEEQWTGLGAARRPLRGLRATDQAPLGSLPRHELRERRRRRQPCRCRRRGAPRGAARSLGRSPRRRAGDGAARRGSPRRRPGASASRDPRAPGPVHARDRPGHRSTSPTSPGIPNAAPARVRHQPGVGPEERTRRARRDRRQPEAATEVGAPRLPRRQGVGTRFE